MKLIVSLATTIVLFGILVVAWAANCSGPRPQIEDVSLEEPQSPDHAYRLSAIVRNKGRNEGEVTISFELINRRDGGVIRARENVELDAKETLTVSTEINAPPGDYEARASVDYPPR